MSVSAKTKPPNKKLKVVLFGSGLEKLCQLLRKHRFDTYRYTTLCSTCLKYTPTADLYVVCVDNKNDPYIEFVETLKKMFPKSKILLCGNYANSNSWQVLFKSEADFVCLGDDDESTILELCLNFDKPHIYDTIMGLGHKRWVYCHGGFREGIFLGNKRPPKSLNISHKK